MHQKQGIRGYKVLVNQSLDKSIEEILSMRFQDDELSKTLDDLYDPYLLNWMKEAVERIKIAHKKQERIIIFWDYDVDGVTSTAILMHFFKKIWMQVSYRLPHRIKDGYGLKNYFIDDVVQQWVTLLITVDCGTKDIGVIQYAKSKWVDVIVTDHHAVPEIIPEEAVAVINPKRKDCTYPFKSLSWAWVAFKLMMALAREFFPLKVYNAYLKESIDIAAIGTVADCMSLTWENRIIVQEWLKQIKNSRSKWIRRLIEHKLEEDLDADVFGFLIWPRLNAAWRMDTPVKALHLILDQKETLDQTLLDIEILNDKRKQLTTLFFEEAMMAVNPNDNILFYDSDTIEHWIIGIVAWRLTEHFYRPSIVLTEHNDVLVASCRSPDFFDIVSLLEKYKHMFITFWWHKQAAGFSIKKQDFQELKKLLTYELNAHDFSSHKKTIYVDKVLQSEEIWFKLVQKINQFKPFWIGNPKPIFMIENFEHTWVSYLWKWVEHIKFNHSFWFKILWFWFGEYIEKIKKSKDISLIFDISEDNYSWKKWLMLKIIDIVL